MNKMLNLFVLGVSNAELFYVKEGVINQYAVKFIVPVPAQLHKLHFTWENLAGKPVSSCRKIMRTLIFFSSICIESAETYTQMAHTHTHTQYKKRH